MYHHHTLGQPQPDNPKRSIFGEQTRGEFLSTDHLNYLFEKVGHIEVVEPQNKASLDGVSLQYFEEALMECALEAGATNIEPAKGNETRDDENSVSTSSSSTSSRFVVTTRETDLWKVAQAMSMDTKSSGDSTTGYIIANCEHRHTVKEKYGAGTAEFVSIQSESEAHDRLGEFLDRLDEDENIDKVYHNAMLVE